MSEIFKIKQEVVEVPVEPQIPLEAPNLKPESELESQPVEMLESWEGEVGNKAGIEYFKAQDFAQDFKIKMDIAKIDKYIKDLITEQKTDKTKQNYNQLLFSLEGEINSRDKDLFTRIKKLAEYTQLLNKINTLKNGKLA